LREAERIALLAKLRDEELRRAEIEGSAEARARARLEDELDQRVQDIVSRVGPPGMKLERIGNGLCVLKFFFCFYAVITLGFFKVQDEAG
jgi:hypothetical protein